MRKNVLPKGIDGAFRALAALATLFAAVALLVLLVDIAVDGAGSLSLDFFTNYASRSPERAGIRAPLFGTLWVIGLTALISLPVSVGAALYLEEYAADNWLTRAVRVNIGNLAGVPSIVYGILGLVLFVRIMGFGRSVLAGALTLSLLCMPMITLAAMEAIRAVPQGNRMAAFGLGASRWQVIRYQVLPLALPRILSGTILALSRAMGEAAPLIMIGFLTFIAFTPESLGDPFTVLPLQIFGWITRGEEFRGLAAAGSIVLLMLLLGMNALAILVRNRLERRT
ncbi:MAG: phosphate ABC transporter permease PstA [Gemmatimonadota bacterium]